MVLEPIGPEAPSTYWMRRAGVLAVLLILALVALRACAGGDDASGVKTTTQPGAGVGGELSPLAAATQNPDAMPGPSDPAAALTEPTAPTAPTTLPTAPTAATKAPVAPTATASHMPKPTPRALARVCSDADIEVTADSDVEVYPQGTTPRLRLTVVNSSATACRRDLGSKALRLLVTSGPARIWSSDDCKPKGTSSLRLLGAGESYRTAVSWPRSRSNAACTGPKGQAQAGTYVVIASAGAVTSKKAPFILR